MKRTPIKRKTPLRSDMNKQLNWQRRSRRPLPKRSKKQAVYDAEFKRQKRKLLPADCGLCWQPADTLHHIKRRAQGGTNDIENLLPICTSCHRWIHDNVAAEKEQGWLD